MLLPLAGCSVTQGLYCLMSHLVRHPLCAYAVLLDVNPKIGGSQQKHMVVMDLDAVLSACLSNDNQIRKPAEEAVKAFAKRPEVVPELLQRLQSAPDPQIRQLSALLLRKCLGKHWEQLSEEARKATQGILLQSIAHEPVHAVRRAVADVAAVVAKQTVPRNQWPELLGTVQQWSQGSSADHRELALTLFSSLAEIIGEYMAPALATLMGIIGGGLGDPQPSVRLAALRAVEQLIPMVEQEGHISAFHGMVAQMLQSCQTALSGGHEDEAVKCFQLLVDACEAPAPLLAPHIPAVVQLACATAAARQFELDTRDQALQVITMLASHKPKQLTKHKELLKAVINMVCTLSCEDSAGGAKDELEAGVMTPRSLAGQTLDLLTQSLSTQHIGPQVLTFARAALSSASPSDRYGALTCLAVMCEGGATWLSKRLDDMLPLVMAGLQDGSGEVRAAAAFAVGQMSEFMTHEMVEHHAQLLPAVLHVMANESDPDLQERACYALDTFCEALEPQEIAPYMGQVMEQLVKVLARGAHVSHAGVQEMALSAIASTVSAARHDFAPHVQAVLPALSHFMSATNPELLPCRCRATEVMGVMMEHLVAGPAGGPPSALEPLLPAVMEASLAGWQLGHSQLREYSHGLWASVAKGLGGGFASYLPHVVPLAFESLAQEEGELLVGDEGGAGAEEAEESNSPGAKLQGNGMTADDSDDSDDEGHARLQHVRSGVMDEKCAAMQALGLYAAHTGPAFLPYLEASMQAAVKLLDQAWHEELQIQAAEAVPRLIQCTVACFPSQAGAAAGGGQAVSPQVQAALGAAVPPLAALLSSDDRAVVCSTLGCWRELLTALGAGPLATWLQEVCDLTAQCLTDKAPCCEYLQDDDEEGDEDGGGESLEELVAAAADLLPVLASACGADQYAPVLTSSHLPALLHRLGPSQPEDLRGISIGALAEVAERMQAHMVPHLPRLIPLLIKELRASEAINRQNAAFAVGVLVEGCGPQASSSYVPQLLQALHPLFSPKEAAGARDNAVGCVARMISCSPPETPIVPLDAVLPAVCAALPPSEDWAEAGPSYRALCQLLAAGDEVAQRIGAHVPAIIRAMAAGAAASQLPAPTRTLIRDTFHAFHARHTAQIGPILASLPQELQQALA